jgi:hypothetical protein
MDDYKEPDMLLEEDDMAEGAEELDSTLLEIEDEELDPWSEELALDVLNKKSKVLPPARFSLEKRRRIEELHEERRLRAEFDYDCENEIVENNDVNKSE